MTTMRTGDIVRAADMPVHQPAAEAVPPTRVPQAVMHIGQLIPDCFLLLDEQGRVVHINAHGVTLMEAREAQLLHQCWLEWWPDAAKGKVRTAMAAARHGDTVRLQAMAPTLKGTPRWWDVTISALPDERGIDAHPMLVVVSRDVTALHEEEAVAVHQRRLLQLALDEGALGSWTQDLETGEMVCSPMFRQHFCLHPTEPITMQDLLVRVVPQGRAAFLHENELALAQAGGHRQEVHVLDSEQKTRVVLTHFHVAHRPGARPLVSGISVDLTNRRMLEASADQAHALVGQLVFERTRRLAELNAHAVATMERERKTLARELHDEMGSILTLMSLELARVQGKPLTNPAELEHTFTQLASLVESLRQYKHRVISGLRPPLLQELGLEMAMQSYVDEFGRIANIEVDADIEPGLPMIKEEAALALFRVLQESLTNTAKYAHATRVQVRFQTDETHLHLEVSDNGQGLPPDTPVSHSFGLQGIRERIQALGGVARFDRVSASGGTRVVVSVPKDGNLEDTLSSAFGMELE